MNSQARLATAGYRLLGRCHRRQPGRHAGHALVAGVPGRLKHCIVIAAAMKLSAQNLAFNEVARQAIESDPDLPTVTIRYKGSVPARPRSGANGRPYHLLVRRRHGQQIWPGPSLGQLDRATKTISSFRYRATCATRAVSFPGIFDANTYISDDPGTGLFRPAPANTATTR